MAIFCQRKRVSMAGPVNPKANTMNFVNGIRIYFQNKNVLFLLPTIAPTDRPSKNNRNLMSKGFA
jgi:hypothetical protein